MVVASAHGGGQWDIVHKQLTRNTQAKAQAHTYTHTHKHTTTVSMLHLPGVLNRGGSGVVGACTLLRRMVSSGCMAGTDMHSPKTLAPSSSVWYMFAPFRSRKWHASSSPHRAA